MRDLTQASVERWRIAGELYENYGEAGWISKNGEDGDFSHAPRAGAEKVFGLRDSAAVKIVLLGQAHHLLEYSREVGWGHAILSGNGVEADIGSVVVVDTTNGLLDHATGWG